MSTKQEFEAKLAAFAETLGKIAHDVHTLDAHITHMRNELDIRGEALAEVIPVAVPEEKHAKKKAH